MRGIREGGQPGEIVLRRLWRDCLAPVGFGFLAVASGLRLATGETSTAATLFDVVILVLTPAMFVLASRPAVWLRPGEIAIRQVRAITTYDVSDILTLQFEDALRKAPVKLVTRTRGTVMAPVPIRQLTSIKGARLAQVECFREWAEQQKAARRAARQAPPPLVAAQKDNPYAGPPTART